MTNEEILAEIRGRPLPAFFTKIAPHVLLVAEDREFLLSEVDRLADELAEARRLLMHAAWPSSAQTTKAENWLKRYNASITLNRSEP